MRIVALDYRLIQTMESVLTSSVDCQRLAAAIIRDGIIAEIGDTAYVSFQGAYKLLFYAYYFRNTKSGPYFRCSASFVRAVQVLSRIIFLASVPVLDMHWFDTAVYVREQQIIRLGLVIASWWSARCGA